MTKPLPKETIQKIRKGVLSGKSKYRVAKKIWDYQSLLSMVLLLIFPVGKRE
jgi:hypothetical protein